MKETKPDVKGVIKAMLDAALSAKDSFNKERMAIMREREKLHIMHQPLDAGYWYQRGQELERQIASLQKALKEEEEKG